MEKEILITNKNLEEFSPAQLASLINNKLTQENINVKTFIQKYTTDYKKPDKKDAMYDRVTKRILLEYKFDKEQKIYILDSDKSWKKETKPETPKFSSPVKAEVKETKKEEIQDFEKDITLQEIYEKISELEKLITQKTSENQKINKRLLLDQINQKFYDKLNDGESIRYTVYLHKGIDDDFQKFLKENRFFNQTQIFAMGIANLIYEIN